MAKGKPTKSTVNYAWRLSKFLLFALILTYIYYICSSNEFQVMVWGCGPMTWQKQCVVVARSTEATSILMNKVTPSIQKGCPKTNEKKKQCKLFGKPEIAGSVPGGKQGLVKRRECVDLMYACYERQNVTIWYHHFHKAGGSTFVMLAQANGAKVMPMNSNGNPLDSNGARIPFWSYTAEGQSKWANEIRKQSGTNLVVTEFDFPNPSQLVAPFPFMYITIFREPVSRLVSNFFWRYRRHFSGKPEPRLSPGQIPNFKAFAMQHQNYYIHMLAGVFEGQEADAVHLAAAKKSLDGFSLVLICEWLDKSAEILKKKLGWKITDFQAFHLKENSGLKDYNLIKLAYGNNWKEGLKKENALDVDLYDYAKAIATIQLWAYRIPPPATTWETDKHLIR